MKSSLQKKVAGILFVFFIVPLMVLIAFFFQYNKISNQKNANKSLETILKIKGQELNLFFENNIESARIYLSMPILKDYLKLRNTPESQKTEEIKEKEKNIYKILDDILDIFQEEKWGELHHIFLVDEKDYKIFMSPDHGKKKKGKPSSHVGQFTGDNQWIKKAFKSGFPQITDHTHWEESDHYHQMIFIPMDKIEGVDNKIVMGMELEIPYEQSLLEKGLYMEENEMISLIGLDGLIINKYNHNPTNRLNKSMIKDAMKNNFSQLTEKINGKDYSNLYFYGNGHPWVLTARLSLEKFKIDEDLNIKNLFLIMPIMLMALLIFAVMLLNLYIVTPIKKLSQITKEFGQGKKENLKKIIHYFSRKDEIGDLAVSVDIMTSQIQRSKDELEEKVLSRTKELEEEQEKSKQKLKELERWQKTTVGRELKMIELKKQIKILQSTSEIKFEKDCTTTECMIKTVEKSQEKPENNKNN